MFFIKSAVSDLCIMVSISIQCFMLCVWLVLSVQVSIAQSCSPFCSPVEMNVYDDAYVYVTVGYPGYSAKMLVDYDEHWIRLASSSTGSTSSTINGQNASIGTESMIVGNVRVTLPVVYGFTYYSAPVDLNVNLYDGVIGLGEKSALWDYWRKSSFSRDFIVLGANDRFLSKKGSAITFGGTFAENKRLDASLNGRPLTLRINTAYSGIKLPHDIYLDAEEKGHMSIVYGGKVWNILASCSPRPCPLFAGEEEDEVVVGTSFLWNHVIHNNYDDDEVTVGDYYDDYSADSSGELFCTMLTCVLIFWLAVELSGEKVKIPKHRALVVVLECYMHFMCALIVYSAVFGMHIQRYVSHWARMEAVIPCSMLGMSVILCSLIDIPFIIGNALKVNKESAEFMSHRPFQLFLSITACGCSVWFTMVESHKSGMSIMFSSDNTFGDHSCGHGYNAERDVCIQKTGVVHASNDCIPRGRFLLHLH